jgi:transcription elongation factor GreA
MAEPISAADALAHFMNSLEPETARTDRPIVEQFVEWFGVARPLVELSGAAVTEYHQGQADKHASDDLSHLEPLRAFLAYCSRMAFTDENLVPFLHAREKSADPRRCGDNRQPLTGEAYHVTLEGLELLERQLEELKAERPTIAEKLRTALADKDFRENAPLDAARDEQAHLEARIRDTEQRLRRAVIIDRDSKHGRANVGSTVKLLNLDRNREQTFTLVSPTEVDPGQGKISIESPMGVAVRNKSVGDEVVVQAPSGNINFRLIEVVD